MYHQTKFELIPNQIKVKRYNLKTIFTIVFSKIKLENISIMKEREYNMGKKENEKNKEISIFHEKDMVDNLKKYYNIDDHFDLLKFIKKNVTNTNH